MYTSEFNDALGKLSTEECDFYEKLDRGGENRKKDDLKPFHITLSENKENDLMKSCPDQQLNDSRASSNDVSENPELENSVNLPTGVVSTSSESDLKPSEKRLKIPKIGNYIHTDLHCFLDQSLRGFWPEQYVAYEVYDPFLWDEKGHAVYIYGRIKECVDDAALSWQKTYKIDVGEIIEAPTVDLYAFLGELHAITNETDLPDTDNVEDKKTDEEIIKEIERMITEETRRDKNTGKKVSKRLFLKWFRDTHAELKELREEILLRVKKLVQELNK